MSTLSGDEAAIYNEGERLIPGRTHDYFEVRRHYASYLFFKAVIQADRAAQPAAAPPLSIVDLGCGVGHGCHTLAAIPGVRVHGVDMSPESLDYARRHYPRDNITFAQTDLPRFVTDMPEFDYVVSRGVLEHVRDGIGLAMRSKWRKRLLFDVPYAEPPGRNPHHLISNITEASFAGFSNSELFFQDLQGLIYLPGQNPPRTNMIMCTCRHPALPPIADLHITFPFTVDWTQCGPEANPDPAALAAEQRRRAAAQAVIPPTPPSPGLFRRAARRLKRIWTGV